MIKKLRNYLAPHRRMARKLRWLQWYAGKHYHMFAAREFADMAKTFENFDKVEK